jgi:hypothetical protein
MTWRKAAPKLIVCIIFDLLRLIFDFFWLFGPVLVGAAVGGFLASYIGSWLAGLIGGATGIAAGLTAGAVFVALGTVLGMVVGVIGWLTILLWQLVTNPRIFHTTFSQKLWVFFGWAISELPLLGGLPAMTFTNGRMFHRQIKHDRAAHQAWVVRQAKLKEQQRAEFEALVAARRARQIAVMRANVANDNVPDSSQAANDNEPRRVDLAA